MHAPLLFFRHYRMLIQYSAYLFYPDKADTSMKWFSETFTKHALISVVHLPWIRRSGPSEVFPTDFLLLNLKKWVSFTGCGLPLRQETLGEFEVPLDEVTFLLDSLPVKKRGDVVNDFKIIPFE